MNLRTSHPSKPGPVKPTPVRPARTSPGRVVALAFFVLLGVGAIDRAAAQSRVRVQGRRKPPRASLQLIKRDEG